MDDDIDRMGIQNLMTLVMNHEEEQHVLDNVMIGKRNPIFLSPKVHLLKTGMRLMIPKSRIHNM